MTPRSSLDGTEPDLVLSGGDGTGRDYWCVRFGSASSYYYRLFRRNLLSATENDLTPEEKTVDVLAKEIMRLKAPPP